MTASPPVSHLLMPPALGEGSSLAEVVEHLVVGAVKTLRTDSGCVTLDAGRLDETLGATHPEVVAAGDAQHELHEGPHRDVSPIVPTLTSSDLTSDARWPRWGPQVSALGLSSVVVAELRARGQRLGTISLYTGTHREFTDVERETLQILAYQGALAISYTISETRLHEAIETRSLIGQAQGILMERFDLDATRAFAVLRRFSQDSNTRLRDVAAETVANRGLATAMVPTESLLPPSEQSPS